MFELAAEEGSLIVSELARRRETKKEAWKLSRMME